jgi:phospholipid transport system substrate-binding protein
MGDDEMIWRLRKHEARCGAAVGLSRAPLICDFQAASIILLLGLMWSIAGFAQTAQGSSSAFVRSLGDEVIAVLQKPDMSRIWRRVQLRKIFLKSFDTGLIARFALGRYWRTATAEQKAQYLLIFPKYVADVYAGQFSNYAGEIFTVIQERRINDKKTIVNTKIQRPNGTTYRVDFRVRLGPGGFKNIDVIVEHLSLLITKRDEFSSVVRRHGMDGLLKRLRQHTERSQRESVGGQVSPGA